MNNKKTSNLLRLIAFFLTGVVLVCTFGFTVDGWMVNENEKSDSSTINGSDATEGKNEDKNNSENDVSKEEVYVPKFINLLTGLETTEELSKNNHIAFVMDGDLPCYGIYGSDITVEIPLEDEKTRLVCIKNELANLWKIGPLADTRGYISNIASFFDSYLICYGNDDIINYESCPVGNRLFDLTTEKGYTYSENAEFIYTNVDLVTSCISTKISEEKNTIHSLPFQFPEFGSENLKGNVTATSVMISYSESIYTELIFNPENGLYTLGKNGEKLVDPLNGKSPEYTNCLVLFADSITYDFSYGSQMIMNTVGTGGGYFITNGTLSNITWTATEAGFLTLYNESGEKLTINRGNTFLSYIKSSKIDNVIVS